MEAGKKARKGAVVGEGPNMEGEGPTMEGEVPKTAGGRLSSSADPAARPRPLTSNGNLGGTGGGGKGSGTLGPPLASSARHGNAAATGSAQRAWAGSDGSAKQPPAALPSGGHAAVGVGPLGTVGRMPVPPVAGKAETGGRRAAAGRAGGGAERVAMGPRR